MIRLLVVCLGNICRSPMGQGALEAAVAESMLAGQVAVDSAGTGGWHAGEAPDPRAIACARRHGVRIDGQRAQQLSPEAIAAVDWVLCADADNLAKARSLAPRGHEAKVVLWLDWAGIRSNGALPDPYYGTDADFERVWQLCTSAAAASVKKLSASDA